jgi:hypothetical protein
MQTTGATLLAIKRFSLVSMSMPAQALAKPWPSTMSEEESVVQRNAHR